MSAVAPASKAAASKAAAAIVLEYMLLVGAESAAELLDTKVSQQHEGEEEDELETAGYEKLRETLLKRRGPTADDDADEDEGCDESLLRAMCAQAIKGRQTKKKDEAAADAQQAATTTRSTGATKAS